MGHYCKICGRTRPNEKFSGKGHKKHICKECSRIKSLDTSDVEEMMYAEIIDLTDDPFSDYDIEIDINEDVVDDDDLPF